ncbi:MAG: hypothetical protein KAQ85_07335 [Thermodesulfovibrionia bacterium]|nr:hypothetical protein [Thermodesulfovibrionia bacterium]
MKTNKKLLWAITVLIILLGGIYGGLKEWTGASSGIADINSEPVNITISDLMASTNMYGLKEPQSPPDFNLLSLDGEKVQLISHRGNVMLLSFWATW